MYEQTNGSETFSRAITAFRNQHIMRAMVPLFTLRKEICFNDDLQLESGIDTTTRDHFLRFLVLADKHRRHITYNPTKVNLKYIEQAINVDAPLRELPNPFGGDEVQRGSGPIVDLPWKLDGSDPNIPMLSKMINAGAPGVSMLLALDTIITTWTRLHSRKRSRFISVDDSLVMYGEYNDFLSNLATFSGDDAHMHIAAVNPSEEPLGVNSSPNMRAEPTITGPNTTYTAGGGSQTQAGSQAAQAAANQQSVPDFLR